MRSEPTTIQAESGRPAENWGRFITSTAAVGIVVLTLFPFQILPRETFLHRQAPLLLWYCEKAFGWKDWLLNVALFVPFGFGAGVPLRRRFGWWQALLFATLASFAFTFAIETLQVFMPTRTSSWYDISANTAGGILGFVFSRIAAQWAEGCLSKGRDYLRQWMRGRKMWGAIAALTILALGASAWLGRAAMLTNWDPTYPLILGNMPNGLSEWQGRVDEFDVSSKAVGGSDVGRVFSLGLAKVAGKNLVALYKPGGPAGTDDLAGVSPRLERQPGDSVPSGAEGLFETNGAWLETGSAAEGLAERIRKTNQFSLYVNFEADQAMQPGVFPIVGMCRDGDHCNFLLAHYYTSLVFRLRTPLTGESAARSDYHQRELLAEANRHQVLITYDGATMRFFADGREAGPAMELGPGPELFRHFHRIGQYQEAGYKMLYYALVFGLLGFLIWLRRLGGRPIRWSGVAGGAIIFAITLELTLALTCRRPFDAMNIVLGLACFLGGYAFFAATVPAGPAQA